MRRRSDYSQISSYMDLCAEIDRLAMQNAGHYPARDCRAVRAEFNRRGFHDFRSDAAAFVEQIFSDGWIWGDEPAVTASTQRAASSLKKDLEQLKLSPEDAAKLARACRKATSTEAVDEVLELANTLLDGYGIEPIQPENAYVDHYYQNIVALYVNMGDPYTGTLLYDTENEEFMVTSWGDFFENWEQEHADEVEEEEEYESDEEEDYEDEEVVEEDPDAVHFSTDPRQTSLKFEGSTRRSAVGTKRFHKAPSHKDMADALGLDLWGYTPDGDFRVGHKGDDQPSFVMTVPELVAEFNTQFDVVPDGRRGSDLVRIEKRTGAARRRVAKLPKDMKGVRKCSPSDCKDTKPYDRRQWCVYNRDDSLAGCHGSKQNALRQKRQRGIAWQESHAAVGVAGRNYRASTRSAAPQLGPEYNIAVTVNELDPEVILWFHEGQGDPIYALGSRLYAYGETLASEDELSTLVSELERWLNTNDTDTDPEYDRVDELAGNAQQLLGQAKAKSASMRQASKQ